MRTTSRPSSICAWACGKLYRCFAEPKSGAPPAGRIFRELSVSRPRNRLPDHRFAVDGVSQTNGRLLLGASFSVLLLLLSRVAAALPDYSDQACSYNSVALRSPPSFAPNIPLKPLMILQSPSRFAVAKVTRSDDLKITYDQEEAHVEITGVHVPALYVRIRVFRALEVRWVTDRILYIWRDLGPTASVEELIDVIDGKWLSQKCVTDDGADETAKPTGDWK